MGRRRSRTGTSASTSEARRRTRCSASLRSSPCSSRSWPGRCCDSCRRRGTRVIDCVTQGIRRCWPSPCRTRSTKLRAQERAMTERAEASEALEHADRQQPHRRSARGRSRRPGADPESGRTADAGRRRDASKGRPSRAARPRRRRWSRSIDECLTTGERDRADARSKCRTANDVDASWRHRVTTGQQRGRAAAASSACSRISPRSRISKSSFG